jgi:GTPase SAR1 family protein
MGVFALVLTGPPGVGKSSVLEALSDALVLDDVRHAVIETEALTAAHPALDDEQWFAPVAAVCRLYRDFGYELLLVAVTVEAEADLRALVRSIGAGEHVVVRLEAEPATLRRRIIEREPEDWSGLEELIGASQRLGPVIAGLDGIALALSTEAQRPAAVAQRIRDRFPTPLRREHRGAPARQRPAGDADREL